MCAEDALLGVVGGDRGLGGQCKHVDAVNRAGRHTKIAAGALIDYNGVHSLRCAQNRVDWAGLNTLGAAYAFIFANKSHHARCLDAVVWIQRQDFCVEQSGQGSDGAAATGWTLIDGAALGDLLRVGQATVMPALSTLGLWQ